MPITRTSGGGGGVTDHGALTGLTDDDHTQYLLRSLVDAKGDLVGASADNTMGRLAVGTDGHVLTADSAQSLGVKWASAGAPAVLSDTTLAATAASFDVSSISQAYTHLRIVAMLRSTAAVTNEAARLRLNNDTASNYSAQGIGVFGTTVTGSEAIAAAYAEMMRIAGGNAPANGFSYLDMDIQFYTGTANHKIINGRSGMRFATGAAGCHISIASAIWFATPAAVDRITVYPATGNWAIGSRLMIYGVA